MNRIVELYIFIYVILFFGSFATSWGLALAGEPRAVWLFQLFGLI